MDIYNEVSSLLNLREVVPPYALGARTCLAKLEEWERYCDIHEHVEPIFEEGDFEQGKFTDLMTSEGNELPIYKKKKDIAGLQAADHYAWEQFYRLKQEVRDKALPPRQPLVALLNAIPKLHVEPTIATLIGLCHAKGIDPRTGIRK